MLTKIHVNLKSDAECAEKYYVYIFPHIGFRENASARMLLRECLRKIVLTVVLARGAPERCGPDSFGQFSLVPCLGLFETMLRGNPRKLQRKVFNSLFRAESVS